MNMHMNDVFKQDAFSVVSLTAAVNKLPFAPGQIGRLGIFHEEGVDTLTILVEMQNGQLALVAPSNRGGLGETIEGTKRNIRPFQIPHYQRDDAMIADEVQGVRAFGSASQVQTVQSKANSKFARHFLALDTTLEHQRAGALKGIVLDKNGNVLTNLFTEFGVSKPAPIKMGLDKTDTKLRTKCFDIIRTIEDTLDGNTYDHLHALVGYDFWIQLIEHPAIRETYLNTAQAAELRGTPMKDKFEFGGIVWERYRTGKSSRASAGADFIANDEARLFPVGVPELFITRFGPADYEDTVNTIGLPRYARQYPMPNGKGRNLEAQMNAISLCTRPEVLHQITIK